MPQFKITAPDGKQYVVTAPDNASQEAVLAYAQSQFGESPEKQARKAEQLAKDREQYAPTNGMGTFDRLASGMGMGMTNAARGVGQLLGMTDQGAIDEAKALDAPLADTTAGKIGNVAGNVAVMAPAALIPGANTVAGSALIGAGTSALTTPGNASDRGMAGLFGGLGGAAGQAIPRVIGSIRAASEPLTQAGRAKIIGRVMNRAVGDEAATVASRLRGAQPLVPGSMPTAAEVGESGGMAALQRAMSAADPEAYAHRGMQQGSARLDALRSIAGDETKMAAAKTAREAASKAIYQQADVGMAPVDGYFKSLMQRPQFQSAIESAQKLAKDGGLDDIFFRDVKGEPIGLIGEGAHFLKKAMDEASEYGSASYTGKASAKAAGDTNALFQKWLEKSIPEYEAAKTAFAKNSVPINQMQIGQALLEKAAPALSDYGALSKETAAKFAQALRSGDQVAATATGFPGATMGKVLDSKQMQLVENVAKDLARKANAQDLGRGVGSNTFQNFAMDNLSQSMGMPSAVKAIGGMIPGVSPTATMLLKGAQGVGGLAYKNAEEQIRRDMAQALLNPQAASRLMEAAARPGIATRAFNQLPDAVKKALPPEELVRLLQATPGIAGITSANAYQQ